MGKEGRIVYLDPAGGIGTEAAFSERDLQIAPVQSDTECLEALEGAAAVVLRTGTQDEAIVDLCRRIRQRDLRIPLVVYASGGSETFAGDVVAAGADGYVPVADGPDTLADRVVSLIDEAAPIPGQLSLAVEQSPLAVVLLTKDLQVITWNPAASDLFGHATREALGEELPTLLVEGEERAALSERWGTVVETEATCREVVSCERADGTTITCEWFLAPLLEQHGEASTVLAFARDVTEDRKRAEALDALQETTQRLLRTSDVETVADLVLEATETVLPTSMASVRLYDPDSEVLEPTATTSTLEAASDTVSTVGEGDGILWETFTGGEPTIIDDASVDMVPYDIDQEVGSAVVYPLGTHGLLTVASDEGDVLDSTDRNLVDVLAATAEAALDQSARERALERTREVVDAIGDSVYALDTAGRFVMVNSVLLEWTGYSRSELMGEHVQTILTEESYEEALGHIGDLFEETEDSAVTYEIGIRRKDGTVIPAEAHSSLLHSDGEIEGTVGTVRDITERKRMKRALQDHTSKIETLHQVVALLEECTSQREIYSVALNAAESVLDFDGCLIDRVEGDALVTETTTSTVHWLERGDRRPLQEDLAATTHEAVRTHRYDDIDEVEATVGHPDIRAALTVPIGDRAVFQALSSEVGAFNPRDEELAELLLTHVAAALDRLEFEDRLREERDRFVALFENVPDALVSAHGRGQAPIVERVNPAFEDVFGYAEETIRGEPLDDYIVPAEDREEAAAINRRGHEGEIVEREVKRRTAEGLRDFMMRVVPMETGSESHRVFSLYTDITDQKQRQQRLEILNRVLRHDLRNGMNIISGSAEILERSVADEESVQFAEAIQERAQELISLAEKTRAVERTLGRDGAVTGPLDIVPCIERAADDAETTYDVDIDRSLPEEAVVRSDDYLETAIFHLLENAVEHNDTGEPDVSISVRESTREDDTVVVEVRDNGPGLPEAERELLDEDKEITQLRHASGLGLWLVNWVVTKSGGRLSFEENEPRGTIVTVALPADELPEVEPGSDSAAASN